MNTGMIYLLVITVIILLFGILYMRLLFKYKQCMQAFNLKKRMNLLMEGTIRALERENTDLLKELEKVGYKNEIPKEHTKINPNNRKSS